MLGGMKQTSNELQRAGNVLPQRNNIRNFIGENE